MRGQSRYCILGTRVTSVTRTFVLALLLAGCGGASGPETVKVSGIVTYKGSPLANGAVLLSPVSTGQGRPAQGVIGSRGEFVISTFEPGDGVVPGDYSIAIVSTIPGTEPLPKDKGTGVGAKSAIPKKYGDPTKSELKESFAKGDAGKRLSLELTD